MIRDGIRMGLLMAVLLSITALTGLRSGLGSGVVLAGGALLLTGIFGGKVAANFGLPRLTGYLLIGILVGPFALGFIPREGVAGLDLVKGLAVSLIALTAGTELQLGLIRRVGKEVARVGALVSLVVFAVIGGAMLLGRTLLPFMEGMNWPQAIAVSALLASVAVSFSPTVTIAILQETRAKGPFSEFLLAIVIIGDLFVMLVFALAAGISKALFGGKFELGVVVGGIGWELLGSVVIGVGIGFGVLIYMKRVGREIPLFLSGLCFVMAELGIHLHLSPLLLSLAAGAVVANLDEPIAQRIHHASEAAGLPVFALFFAAAGASLQLDVLLVVGPAALGLVVLRTLSLYFATRAFGPKRAVIRDNLWLGLISQAGVTFGLAALIGRSFPTWGLEMETLIIAMVTLQQLIGPLLTRRALANAGEIREEPRRSHSHP
ncbi:MAG: cation:proton antiporter [Myxococcota bacterium]|nr:cation:proton antiporter [Myxococcota bacterium]